MSKSHKEPVIFFRNFVFPLIIFVCILSSLPADIAVDLEIPELGEGMEQLERVLTENIAPMASDMENTVTELLEKPLITGAFASAAGMTAVLPFQGSLFHGRRVTLSFGFFVSLYSETFDIETLTVRIEELSEEDDFPLGANIHAVNFSAAFSLPVPGLTGLAAFSYSDISGEQLYVNNFSVQAGAGYSPFRDMQAGRAFSWSPLYFRAGAGYYSSRIGAYASTGIVTREFEADPDGSGPLIGQTISVEVDPTADISLLSRIGTFSAALSTGISLLDFFHLYAGAGALLSIGRTDIAVDYSSPITVLGYLAELVEEEGSIGVTGTVEGSEPLLLMPTLFTGIQFGIGPFLLHIPFSWQPPGGIAAGVSLGVSL